MHKAKNISFFLIKKKRDGLRQGVAQGSVPSPIYILPINSINLQEFEYFSL